MTWWSMISVWNTFQNDAQYIQSSQYTWAHGCKHKFAVLLRFNVWERKAHTLHACGFSIEVSDESLQAIKS